MSGQLTTVAVPDELVAALDRLVEEGRARSRSELVESALRREVAEARRARVDAEFRHMANDPDYQEEARLILAEFARADWEALRENAHPEAGPPQP
ncbi:MAG: ribbon-helix-helix protein, CopG family [Acidobacteria bacterium]|nr:ribbon-helix-helix protein, CopG family [Acidobacteriota bacterium]